MGCIVGAALGDSIFFEYMLDKNCVFICQVYTISFFPGWYKVENTGNGVQFLEEIPYWIEENIVRSYILRSYFSESKTNQDSYSCNGT